MRVHQCVARRSSSWWGSSLTARTAGSQCEVMQHLATRQTAGECWFSVDAELRAAGFWSCELSFFGFEPDHAPQIALMPCVAFSFRVRAGSADEVVQICTEKAASYIENGIAPD